MTTFADVQNAIQAGVQYLGVVPNSAVSWSDDSSPASKVCIILDLLDLVAVIDRQDTDPTTAAWSLSTQYYLRVQVRAESIYNKPGRDALISLEAVRAGLQRPDIPWASGVVYQADAETYVHHVSYMSEGRMLSSYSFETGFRAVIDYPTAPATVQNAPNMQEVDAFGTAADGETPTPEIDLIVTRN